MSVSIAHWHHSLRKTFISFRLGRKSYQPVNGSHHAKIAFPKELHMSLPSKATSSELSELLKRKIESRTAKVGVIGMGYVGLPLALLFSEQKFPVTGFDIDKKKIDVLESGGSYIYRIAPTEIQAARTQGFKIGRA